MEIFPGRDGMGIRTGLMMWLTYQADHCAVLDVVKPDTQEGFAS